MVQPEEADLWKSVAPMQMSGEETDDEEKIVCRRNCGRRSEEINSLIVALDERVNANKKRTQIRQYADEF